MRRKGTLELATALLLLYDYVKVDTVALDNHDNQVHIDELVQYMKSQPDVTRREA